ncbi:MAG: AMP-binding protein [Proteobacteria bacterium]|nr:AMP-binding protein [Pseudomonadota bacterium]
MKTGKMGIRELETDSFENYRQNYRKKYPLCTFKNVLENLAKSSPDKTAFIQGERKLTWKQFDERTNQIANFLLNQGLNKGDRIGINGFNSIEWMESFWGASKAGFAPVYLNPRYVAEECKYVLKDSDSVVLFTEDLWVDSIEKIRDDLPLLKKIVAFQSPGHARKEIPEDPIYIDYKKVMNSNTSDKPYLNWEIENDDLCYFKYTGGTTGYPKGVIFDNWRGCGGLKWGMLSTLMDSGWNKMLNAIAGFLGDKKLLSGAIHTVSESKRIKKLFIGNVVPTVIGRPLFYKIAGGKRSMIHCAPLFHGLGFNSNMMGICALGGISIYLEPAHPFKPKLFWETVNKHKPFGTSIVGDAFATPMVEELEKAEKEGKTYDTSSLFYVGSSGVRWSAEMKKRFLKKVPGCMIIDGYGSAESVGGYASVSSAKDEKIQEHTTPAMDSFGYGAKRLVLDMETQKPAKPGCKSAKFLYGGPHTGLGYWKAPELTKKTYVDVDGERYVVSGDEGYLDDKGGFHLMGRGGGYMINTGGEKVYSEEVEEIIKSNPMVRDAAVVGLQDKKWGEAVAAVVELDPKGKASKEEIIDYCRGKIAGYKIPKTIIFHEVERKDTGKTDRPKMITLFTNQ